MEWAREGEGKESDLSWLMAFLQKEIQRRKRSSTFKESGGSGGASALPDVTMEMQRKPVTAAVLRASSESASGCGFCGGRHPSDRCFGVLALSIPERKQKVQSSGLCFKCLSKTHIAKQCSSKYAKCKGRHNGIICSSSGNTSASYKITPDPSNTQTVVQSVSKDDTVGQTSNTTSTVRVAASTNGVGLDKTKRVILQCARVRVHGDLGVSEANVLFDTGSDRTYISTSLVQRVSPKYVESQPIAYAAFGRKSPNKAVLRHIYQVELDEAKFLATEVPVICAPV